VVAERHDVGTRIEQLVGQLAGDARAVGDVLAVDDTEVGGDLSTQARKATPNTSARKRSLSSG
jgi:hypothetical protein